MGVTGCLLAIVCAFCSGLCPGPAMAIASLASESTAKDPAARSLVDLSVEELLDLEVQVASAEPLATRDAPAVVTVVTRDEIEQSGARDLIDVLRRVPGFDFGLDVWGVVGLGFRGQWGHEAKIMLAVDGLILNEPMYGNLTFGNHIPVGQIERIEIVRGPGSVIHGNFAELAVINVITRIGSEQTGPRGSVTSGWFEDDYARLNLDFSYGRGDGHDTYLGVSASGGLAQRSSLRYTALYGDSYDMSGDQELKARQLGVHYRRGGLRAQMLYDDYRTTARDAYDEILSEPRSEDFISYLANLAYAYSPRPEIRITPEFRAALQTPWHNADDPSSDWGYYDTDAQRYTGLVKVNWDPSARLALLAGGQYEWEGARYGDLADYFFPNGEHTIDYRRRALFAEAYLKTAPVRVTAGLRWEGHSEYNSAFAPRLGLTRTFGDIHVKLIYNHSYRAPSIEQISSGLNLKTEEADVFEMEIGRKLGPSAYCGINLYDIRQHRPLIFVAQEDMVCNVDDYGSRGVEAEGRLQRAWGEVTARYSYYVATGGVPEYYAVPGEEHLVLAFPAHKLVLTARLRASAKLTVSSTVIWTSAKYAYDHADPDSWEPLLSRLGAEAPADVYLRYRGLFASQFWAGLGVHDLFAENHVFAQPYNGLHAPLPGPGREFILRVGYGSD